jgi:hypothetical protein
MSLRSLVSNTGGNMNCLRNYNHVAQSLLAFAERNSGAKIGKEWVQIIDVNSAVPSES